MRQIGLFIVDTADAARIPFALLVTVAVWLLNARSVLLNSDTDQAPALSTSAMMLQLIVALAIGSLVVGFLVFEWWYLAALNGAATLVLCGIYSVAGARYAAAGAMIGIAGVALGFGYAGSLCGRWFQGALDARGVDWG